MSQPGPQAPVKQICAVYDKATGRIIHLHHNIAVAGATPPSEAKLHATALTLATHKRWTSSQRNARQWAPHELATLSIDDGRLKRGYQYSIDPTTRDLLERPARQA